MYAEFTPTLQNCVAKKKEKKRSPKAKRKIVRTF